MPDIVLVRQQEAQFTEEELAIARRVIFGMVDGLGQGEQKKWRRFWNGLMRLGAGELAEIETRMERAGPYHRKHMLMEQRVFEAQERFELFEAFRDWLKVGAGHCEWFPNARGGIFPRPKSIAYKNLEQGAMQEFHDNAVAFLRSDAAGRSLWPHANQRDRIDSIEAILHGLNE